MRWRRSTRRASRRSSPRRRPLPADWVDASRGAAAAGWWVRPPPARSGRPGGGCARLRRAVVPPARSGRPVARGLWWVVGRSSAAAARWWVRPPSAGCCPARPPVRADRVGWGFRWVAARRRRLPPVGLPPWWLRSGGGWARLRRSVVPPGRPSRGDRLLEASGGSSGVVGGRGPVVGRPASCSGRPAGSRLRWPLRPPPAPLGQGPRREAAAGSRGGVSPHVALPTGSGAPPQFREGVGQGRNPPPP